MSDEKDEQINNTDNTNNIIQFPKLVDSSVSSSIITLDDGLNNPKQRVSKINLVVSAGNNSNSNSNSNNLNNNSSTYICDYPNMVNLSYKLRSTCKQIEESIKQIVK